MPPPDREDTEASGTVPCRVVVDTSVLKGLSEKPGHRHTLDFLGRMIELQHVMVVDGRLDGEHQHERSKLGRLWRARFLEQGLVRIIPPSDIVTMTLDLSGYQESSRGEIERDRHVIECALSTDCIIATNERMLQVHLGTRREGRPYLEALVWLRPQDPEHLQKLDTLKPGRNPQRTS